MIIDLHVKQTMRNDVGSVSMHNVYIVPTLLCLKKGQIIDYFHTWGFKFEKN